MTITREQICDMTDGREMDALVAEKVFGIYRADFPGVNGESHFWTAVERYSTEPSAAWQIVEKLRETDRLIDIGCHYHGWACDIDRSRMPHFWANADTMPLAVCRAALLFAESVNVSAVCESSAQLTATSAPVPQKSPVGEGWGSL